MKKTRAGWMAGFVGLGLAALCWGSAVGAGERAQVVTDIRLDAGGAASILTRAELPPAYAGYGPERGRDNPARVLGDALAERVLVELQRVNAYFGARGETLTIEAWSPALARLRDGAFEIEVPGRAAVTYTDRNVVVASHYVTKPDGMVILFVNRYYLPRDSFYDNYNVTAGVMTYRMEDAVRAEWHLIREVNYNPGNLPRYWGSRCDACPPREGVAAYGAQLPPGISAIRLDFAHDGAYLGSVILEHGQLGLPPTILPMRESKIDNEKVTVKATLHAPVEGRDTNIHFDFNGQFEPGGLAGQYRYELRRPGEKVRLTEQRIVFYQSR